MDPKDPRWKWAAPTLDSKKLVTDTANKIKSELSKTHKNVSVGRVETHKMEDKGESWTSAKVNITFDGEKDSGSVEILFAGGPLSSHVVYLKAKKGTSHIETIHAAPKDTASGIKKLVGLIQKKIK